MSIVERSLCSLAALSCVLFVGTAHAGPSARDTDDMLDAIASHSALEVRGFLGYAPGFPALRAHGGDFRLAIQGSSFGVTLGARLGGDGDGTQFVGFDGGFRVFPDPARVEGLFFAGGILAGSQTVDGFSFRTGSLYGGWAEAGLEWPRAFPLRLTMALRADVGAVNANRYSRIVPDPFFRMVSLNVGFMLGGASTGAAR